MSEQQEKGLAPVKNSVSPKGEEKPKKKRKVWNILGWVLTGIFGLFFVFFAVCFINGSMNKKNNYGLSIPFGYGTALVQTDSMAYDFKGNECYPIGSSVFTKKKDFSTVKTGDDLWFYNYLSADDYSVSEGTQTSFPFIHRTIGYVPVSSEEETIQISFVEGTSYPVKITNPTSSPFWIVMGANVSKEAHDDSSKTSHYGSYQVQIVFATDDGNTLLANYKNRGSEIRFSLPDYINPETTNYYSVTGAGVYLGTVIGKSKVAGKIMSFVTSIWGLLILLLIPALFLVISGLKDIAKAFKEQPEEGEKDKPSSSSSSDPLAGLSEEDKQRLKDEMLEQLMNQSKGGKK